MSLVMGGAMLAGGALNYLGGLQANRSNALMNRAGMEQNNQQFTTARQDQLSQWGANFREQRQLARHGISIRMEDAKRAGIHPLAAMGMPTTGGSPVSVGGGPQPNSSGQIPMQAPADLTRPLMAIAEIVKAGNQNNAMKPKDVQQKPDIVTKGKVATKGVRPSVSFTQTKNGLLPTVSKDLKELIEDSPQEVEVQLRNRVMGGTKPPQAVWKKAYPWAKDVKWDVKAGVWKPLTKGQVIDRKRAASKARKAATQRNIYKARQRYGTVRRGRIPGGP